jgi:hypothetical protein
VKTLKVKILLLMLTLGALWTASVQPAAALPPVQDDSRHLCYVDCVDAYGDGYKAKCYRTCYLGEPW